MRVSVVEFTGGFDEFPASATSEPVTIVDGGRDRLVLMSVDEHARLTDRDRSAPVTEGSMRIEGGMPGTPGE